LRYSTSLRHLSYLAVSLPFIGSAIPAHALSITFSGQNPITIRDTDPGQRPGVITLGLTTDQGYGVTGTLVSTTSATQSAVTLEGFHATYLQGAPAGLVTVTFQETFAGPAPSPPVTAIESISAVFQNDYGSNQIGGFNSLLEGSFVGATFINPIMSSGNNGPIQFNPPFGNFSAIIDGHGPAQIAMGGPPWTLEGSFMFALSPRVAGVAGFPGDSLVYTQDIRITVPAPASVTLVLFGLALFMLMKYARAQRMRASQPTCRRWTALLRES